MIEQVKKLLIQTKLENESGSVIYSGDETLTKGNNYFLGTNPGGNAGKPYGEDSILNQLLNSGSENEYFEGDWGNPQHQTNIKYMFEILNIDLWSTFSTNAAFIRSPGETSYPRNLKFDAETTFWPIQEYFLSIVQPSLIITNGSIARNLFWKKMYGKNFHDSHVSQMNKYKYLNSKNKSCYIFQGDLKLDYLSLEKISVISIPHLSWKDVNFHKEGIEWCKSRLDYFSI